MSDLERTIRDAQESLPEPEQEVTKRARRAVLAAAPQGRPRGVARLALVAVVLVAALSGAFAAGLALAPGGATKAVRADGPGFLPAQGWDTFQTGITSPPYTPTATAANISIGADAIEETFPWRTIARLHRGQVLLQAIFNPTGQSAGIDRSFPPRTLPLSLEDARPGAPLEGQPPNASADHLLARVNGYNVQLFVFYGERATPAARTAAREELRRLVVPKGTPGPLITHPALRPTRGTCQLPQLRRARAAFNGATGSLLGSIRLRNVSRRSCELHGRPTVELLDANGVPLNARESAAPPLWKQLGSAKPRDWPIVRLAPGGTAQVFVRLLNWCVLPVKPVFFHVYLPGVGEAVHASARVTLGCNAPKRPAALAVGPVEPVR